MKIKRYKKAERYMTIYKNNFGFREPYQVLLDGTFCQVALVHQVNIQDQLPKYLSGQCKLLTTACVIDETKRLGKPLHGSYTILSQFPIHNCGHESPISASKCLSSFLIDSNNKDHYIIATQDHKLREKLSRSVVCPLIKLANNALVMEKPPKKVLSKVNRTHHYLANKMTDMERESLAYLKKEANLEDLLEQQVKRKPRGKKGPNPLSCKKRTTKKTDNTTKSTDNNQSDSDSGDKKRRRKRTRLARHVVKLLKENLHKPGQTSS